METNIPSGSVVVGVDGSEHSDRALEWAAGEAASERRPLVLVHATFPPSPGAGWCHEVGEVTRAELISAITRDAHLMLERAAARVRGAHPCLEVHEVVRLDDAREALLDAAADAHVLVLGSRGLGPIRQLLLGSVSMAVSKHARAPVVVVRPGPRKGPVVVGVAGEPEDGPVLDFAFRVAEARGLPITLVHAFWDVVGASETSRDVPVDEPGYEDRRAILTEAARAPSGRHPSVAVNLLLTKGFANVQLVRASDDAALVVMGHRRKPFLHETVYGSAAPYVVEHAHCSVAVVPITQGPTALPSSRHDVQS